MAADRKPQIPTLFGITFHLPIFLCESCTSYASVYRAWFACSEDRRVSRQCDSCYKYDHAWFRQHHDDLCGVKGQPVQPLFRIHLRRRDDIEVTFEQPACGIISLISNTIAIVPRTPSKLGDQKDQGQSETRLQGADVERSSLVRQYTCHSETQFEPMPALAE